MLNNNTQDFYVEVMRTRSNFPELTMEELLVSLYQDELEYRVYGITLEVAAAVIEKAYKVTGINAINLGGLITTKPFEDAPISAGIVVSIHTRTT